MGANEVKLQGTMLVGIGHKARQGKDTLAWILADYLREWNVDARVYAFADALRTTAFLEHGMVEKDAKLLQELGYQYRKFRGEDIWISTLMKRIFYDKPRVAIISDTRYENEGEEILRRKGLLIRVIRPGFLATDRPEDHPSETEGLKIPWHETVFNSGTKLDLEEHARKTASMVVDVLMSGGGE